MWWIRNDPCGLFSALFTVLLLLYSQYVVTTVILLPWYGAHYHLIFYSLATLLSLVSHTRAQFTNPGVVPRHLRAVAVAADGTEMQPRSCRRCRAVKPYAAHHCSTCARCIIRMDHHCPWVNNCVAIFNQKYFLLFLLYTAVCCVYAGSLLVARFVSCTHNMRLCPVTPVQTALCIVNFVEALVFGLFCAIMMADQLAAILDNTPGIDALQGKKGERRGRYQSLCTVMGERIGWRWLLPVACNERLRAEFEEELRLDGSHSGSVAGGSSEAGARQASDDGLEHVAASTFPSLAAAALSDSSERNADEERKAHFSRDDATGGREASGGQGGIIGMIQSVYGDEMKEEGSLDSRRQSQHERGHHSSDAHRHRPHSHAHKVE